MDNNTFLGYDRVLFGGLSTMDFSRICPTGLSKIIGSLLRNFTYKTKLLGIALLIWPAKLHTGKRRYRKNT